jgi:ATP-dependent DNA helicase DinG
VTNLVSAMYDLWETACIDAPQRPSAQVIDGHFVLTVKGNRDNWTNLVTAAGVPSTATQTISGDTLTCRWLSHADAIFGDGGLLARHFGAGYEVRMPQVHMARLVQRSIEMSAPAVIEAGTGTGKSFAYAAIAMAMNKKLVISTSNKNLQMQLIGKDLPFLSKLFPGKTYAIAQGKNNYACRIKAEVLGDVVIADPALKQWYLTTETGNTEEITFAAERKDVTGLSADDECTGKHCLHYHDCFYYQARAAMKSADVIVTNHKLLCLDVLAEGNILPPADVTVIDEAHKLADYARSTIGVDFTLPQLHKALALADGYASPAQLQTAENAAMQLEWAVTDYLRDKDGSEIAIHASDTFSAGATLASALTDLAAAVWPEDELPSNADETRLAKRATRIRKMATNVHVMAAATPAGFVRWVKPGRNADPLTLCAQPFNVAEFIGTIAGVTPVTQAAQTPDYTRCSRCSRHLTATNVAILDGKPFGPECIHHVDAFGDAETVRLTDWLAMEHAQVSAERTPQATRAVVFCSATLAAPDMAHFLRTAGLPDAMQMLAASPFDYESNAVLYLPAGSAPAPNTAAWQPWAIDQMRDLVLAAQGGAFLLFTSYRMMNDAAAALRGIFQQRRLQVFVQGELPKLEIAKQFRNHGNAVLFATKSFFEGVSIDGDALRLVVVDKMPFEAPSPLTTAMEADATARGLDAFRTVRLPRMTIELKQATGRLIRTQTDRGVMAVLDSRIRATPYGRNSVIPALPPATLTSHSERVEAFFSERKPGAPMPVSAAIPMVVPAIALDDLVELPF